MLLQTSCKGGIEKTVDVVIMRGVILADELLVSELVIFFFFLVSISTNTWGYCPVYGVFYLKKKCTNN